MQPKLDLLILNAVNAPGRIRFADVQCSGALVNGDVIEKSARLNRVPPDDLLRLQINHGNTFPLDRIQESAMHGQAGW